MNDAPLTPAQIEALRDMSRVWQGVSVVIVGATALGFSIPMVWRKTNDLDVTVAVPVEELPAGMNRLLGWEPGGRGEQEWIAPGDVRVDILPVGRAQLESGKLIWPSGFEMSLVGYRHVFEQAADVMMGPELVVRVAPLPVVVLLKMAAFLDRPWERERDLEDVGHVLEEYLRPDEEERRFADDVFDAGLSYDEAPAYWLGRDMRDLVNSEERALVEKFLDVVGDENGAWHARMLRAGPPTWLKESTELTRRIAAFRLGFSVLE